MSLIDEFCREGLLGFFCCSPRASPDEKAPALKVRIIGAKGLRNTDRDTYNHNLSDPYCICEIPGKPGSKIKTHKINNTLDPIWNYDAFIPCFSPGDLLVFTVWDKGFAENDELLGKATLKPDRYYPSGFQGELALSEAGHGINARLTVSVLISTVAEMEKFEQNIRELTRQEMILVLFQELCPKGKAKLESTELRTYAENCGFEGSEYDWSQEYANLLEEHGWIVGAGVSVEQFGQIVDDQESGVGCDDEELTDVLRNLGIAVRLKNSSSYVESGTANIVTNISRADMANAIFHTLDVEAKGRLKAQQMLPFVSLCGFIGNSQNWEQEFEVICNEQGWNPLCGISRDEFASFVNEPQSSGYCDDRDLPEVFTELGRHARERDNKRSNRQNSGASQTVL